ncbi:MAG: hypothetical protein J6U04_10700 [Salinivirgaceae bacterium]|nr:hypothetical protein [Salinivirgaceae bacterium]
MGIISYIQNQIRHDGNIKYMLADINAKISTTAHNILLSERINYLRDKTINCSTKGISIEKLCDNDIVVSLTTFGDRIHNVHLAIESIMQGTVKPNRIVLWLAEDEFTNKRLPKTLKLQQERGLEIYYYKNIRSYLKLIPSLEKYSNSCIITIDDDVIYEYDLIERLVNAHIDNPNKICACRMHRIVLGKNNNPLNYLKWKLCINDTECSNLNFPTGVGGVLYPPHCFNDEVFNSEIFMDVCPKADDIWFYVMALINGIQSIWVKNSMPEGYYYSLPMYTDALCLQNTIPNEDNICGNDIQFMRVCNKYKLLNYWT